MSQARRFFASIEVPDRRVASRIFEFEFDFFEEGREARALEAGRLEAGRETVQRLGCLLTLEQVEQLVRAGIPVLVREDATPQLSQPVPTAEFEEWIKDFEQTFPAPKAAQSLGGSMPTSQARKRKKP
jgi:hypothetical protein